MVSPKKCRAKIWATIYDEALKLIKNRKQVLVIAFSHLNRDPRVYRQIIWLKNSYDVTAAGYDRPSITNIKFIKFPKIQNSPWQKLYFGILLKLGKFEQYYWSIPMFKHALEKMQDLCFDLIIANDIEALPLACSLKQKYNCKVLLDAHEYKPREFDDQFIFNFFFKSFWDYICKTYLPRIDSMTTVCEGISHTFFETYGVESKIIINAPFYENLKPTIPEPGSIRMIHHGGINRSRKIEKMIYLMDYLDDRFSLDFMIVNTNPSYLKRLRKLAKGNSRINFIDPVPMPQISSKINKYDIGLYLLWPESFNNRLALPNKLFEFIQARLAVAILPSPEMSKVVNTYNCGTIAHDFNIQSMAEVLMKISPDELLNLKLSAHRAAEKLCAEKMSIVFSKIVNQLLGN